MVLKILLAAALAVPALVAARTHHIRGHVGPLTTVESKRAVKECNIKDYGATADGTTDISSALNGAFTACSAGGVVVVPSGNYALENWVTFSGESA